MKNIFKCVMIIVGTLVGAGFASGQEIATFFNRFSNEGLCGLICSCLLFGIVIFTILMLINKYNVEKYEELINGNKIILLIMKIFCFVCFCIMISAIGSFGEQEYGISFWYGAIFAGIVCFVLFLFKFSGLEKINNILVPLILIGIVVLGLVEYDSDNIVLQGSNVIENNLTNNWFLSAMLYTGYNSILLIPILVELKLYKLNKAGVLQVSIFVALVLSIAGILIYGAINTYFPDILSSELPTLVVANACGKLIKCYYSSVILFAIFTTAFSCGYSFLKMNSESNYFRNTCLICAFGIILSRIGFSKMINFFFPLFGYWGILQILIIIYLIKKKGIYVEKK